MFMGNGDAADGGHGGNGVGTATSSVESVAIGVGSQSRSGRPRRSTAQEAPSEVLHCTVVRGTSPPVRALSPRGAQPLRMLNTPSPASSGVVLNDAEKPTRDSSHMPTRSALPPLTPSQHKVLNTIEMHIEVRGFPPSMRELAASTGLAKTTIEEKLAALVRLGHLRHDAGEDRGLAVLVASSQARVVEPRPVRKAMLCHRCRREVG